MESNSAKSDNLYFLQGGGEMGNFIRSTDWGKTPLGDPEYWSNSLKTMVGVMLDNPFGMYIAWGKEYIQIYNDGYRPILGSTKHPQAVGISSRETFSEIWHIIGPMFEGVMNGIPVGFPDFMLPLNRNGFVEECYFDFSYSPIRKEDGEVGGILVTVIETTNKKKTEDKLKESEARFRTMAEGTDLLIAVGDETSNAIYFNRAWTSLTGRKMEDLLEFGWVDLIHPDDRERYVKIYLDAFEKKESFTGEFRLLSKDGEYRWQLASGPPRYNPDGTFAGYISSCVDITERKSIEKKLKESEHLLSNIVDSAPFPIGVYTGSEMKIELANQAILDAWGKGNDVVGKLYTEILPELDNQKIFQQISEVYKTGISFHAKNQQVNLVVNGKLQPYFFNYSFTPLFNINGSMYGVVNTAADVTDINLANLKVKESERNLKQTILQSPVAMCILKGQNYVVELANSLMYELWGKSYEEIHNKPIFEGLPEAKNQGLEALLDNVYNTGETFSAEGVPLSLPRKGKIETVYINFVYEAYRDGDGSISGILAVAIDVTPQVIARQKIEEVVADRTKELANANKDLQKSNAELSQFAYIASHDLQEPLRKISNFTQLLENRSKNVLDESSKNYLQKINNSASRMHALIRDVLSYSELVKENELFEEVNLQLIGENILVDFELLIEQKKASIEFENLPIIEAIPLQMSQLFGNLISNSLKFARQDIKPIIRISCIKLNEAEKTNTILNMNLDYVKIVFKDNGIGFKEEYTEQIFNIFQRLHRKSEYEGTGIGLAMCKKIALNHHGELNAIGSSENGAIFNVYLPISQKAKME